MFFFLLCTFPSPSSSFIYVFIVSVDTPTLSAISFIPLLYNSNVFFFFSSFLIFFLSLRCIFPSFPSSFIYLYIVTCDVFNLLAISSIFAPSLYNSSVFFFFSSFLMFFLSLFCTFPSSISSFIYLFIVTTATSNLLAISSISAPSLNNSNTFSFLSFLLITFIFPSPSSSFIYVFIVSVDTPTLSAISFIPLLYNSNVFFFFSSFLIFFLSLRCIFPSFPSSFIYLYIVTSDIFNLLAISSIFAPSLYNSSVFFFLSSFLMFFFSLFCIFPSSFSSFIYVFIVTTATFNLLAISSISTPSLYNSNVFFFLSSFLMFFFSLFLPFLLLSVLLYIYI